MQRMTACMRMEQVEARAPTLSAERSPAVRPRRDPPAEGRRTDRRIHMAGSRCGPRHPACAPRGGHDSHAAPAPSTHCRCGAVRSTPHAPASSHSAMPGRASRTAAAADQAPLRRMPTPHARHRVHAPGRML